MWFWGRGERFILANGPTFDEGVHLAAGYSYCATGSFRLNAEDPPLLKLLWSLPLVLGQGPSFPREIAVSPDANHWHVADALVYRSGVPPQSIFAPARRVNLALGCSLLLLVAWISFRVWNSPFAGVVGCAFTAADPTLLALSCVLTTDVGVSLFSLLTCYLSWEYAANPSRSLLLALGVGLGLMLTAKFSSLGVVVGLAAAGGLFVRFGGRLSLPGKHELGYRPALELGLRLGVIAILVTAATYGFLHFPEWAKGLKFQLTRGSHGDGVAYLNGVISREGWYDYFVQAMLLKLPLGLLLAAAVAGAVHFRRLRADSSRTAFLIVPPVVFFLLASFSRVNVGVRAVYPFVPFLYLLAAGLAVPGAARVLRGVVLAICIAWCIVSAHGAGPREITYFNEFVASGEGLKYLADSNLDWGQGLPALKEWMDANGVETVYLGYFGTDRPEAHGIRNRRLPGYGLVGPPRDEPIPPGASRHIVAVSTNHLLGLFLKDTETYAWLRERPPLAVPGGCIHVFDVSSDPVAVTRIQALSQR
jgi:hypothetical protein